MCGGVIKCKPNKQREMKRQDDGDNNSLFFEYQTTRDASCGDIHFVGFSFQHYLRMRVCRAQGFDNKPCFYILRHCVKIRIFLKHQVNEAPVAVKCCIFMSETYFYINQNTNSLSLTSILKFHFNFCVRTNCMECVNSNLIP